MQLRLVECAVIAADWTGYTPAYWGKSEKSRWDTLSTLQQRMRFLAGRSLLRDLLVQQWGGEPADWQLTAEIGQAPTVLGHADCYLSLSHSADYILAATGNSPMGVDIEAHGRARPVDAMAEHVCHPSERAYLSSLPPMEAQLAFAACWTQKEAWLKGLGRGLNFSAMSHVRCSAASPGQEDMATWQSDRLTVSVFGAQLSSLRCDWQIPAPPARISFGTMQHVLTAF